MAVEECTVEHDLGRTLAKFPYNAELIERIKDEISWYNRAWSNTRKAWTFTPEGWKQAAKLIEEYYPIVD